MTTSSEIRVFGIRHHGPGSARHLRRALEAWVPDLVLVEGPPEADELVPMLAETAMRPPVALLVYVPDRPRLAALYPFTEFSPEWQALHYALAHNIPARFMDLPQAHGLALLAEAEATPKAAADEPEPGVLIERDPLSALARAAGEDDGEAWWERWVEQRRDGADLFQAIQEAMAASREGESLEADARGRLTARREAHMRQTIRAAQKQGHQRIAVVCGAWHAPMLSPETWPPAKADGLLLKGLPKVPVQATWTPWSNRRLARMTGYGAGVASPGWYAHLWHHPERTAEQWLTRVAHLLREKDLDASTASVIEAVHLAEALAALRSRSVPGLPELTEATVAVLCHGVETPLRLIAEALIVGDALGQVPDDAPTVPLQRDLAAHQKRLRLPPKIERTALDLDLRKPIDLERSQLLHRLTLLQVRWGEMRSTRGSKGTFREEWQLAWDPGLAVAVVEAARWGNTVQEAAERRAREAIAQADRLNVLTDLLARILLADLPALLPDLLERITSTAAVTSDSLGLMQALPPLVNAQRYGDVRATDGGLIRPVVSALILRIAIGLPNACTAVADEAAQALREHVLAAHAAVLLLDQPDERAAWVLALARVSELTQGHRLLLGCATRLLLDQRQLNSAEVAHRLTRMFSPGEPPEGAAAFVEGLLTGSGLLLVHDDALWLAIDGWVNQVAGEVFEAVLPLLRRTFATFSAPERRQLAARVRPVISARPAAVTAWDTARGDRVLPVVAQLLGLQRSP